MRLALIIPLLLGGPRYVPKHDFALTITIYRINSQKLWTYALDMTGISVTRHSPGGEPDLVVHRRALTLKEIKKLDRFVGRYPFDSLEKYYINEGIHGDTGTVYCIRIHGGITDHYVYYARPGRVQELNRFINRLLPRQYRLWDEER
ncbi:MAG TPA: hypothetical protein PKN50_02080 [Spirochaetota bacterium]|nr:hypothetical protein [Spirochaetota bacterium]HPV40177.1 hypothetical protein [Spirochaetota bacterium]